MKSRQKNKKRTRGFNLGEFVDLLIVNPQAAAKMSHEYASDWVSLYQFLSDEPLVETYLNKLEDELQASCANNPNVLSKKTKSTGQYQLPDVKNDPYVKGKILSSHLYLWAKDNGFSQRAKIYKSLPPHTFYKMLSTNAFFKDCATNVGSTHGAWSHALQWYCIIEHHKKTGFLSHAPIDVYQSFADAEQEDSIVSLWDAVLDGNRLPIFTSPDYFTDVAFADMKQKQPRRPLLSETIVRDELKMREKYGDVSSYTQRLYKKHKGEQNIREGIIYRSFASKP